MKNDLNRVPLGDQILKWSQTANDWVQLGSVVEKAEVGSSENNPASLPAALAQAPATERFQWALAQLAKERQAVAAAKTEQSRGASLLGQFQNLHSQRRTEERARARKRFVRLSVVTTVLLAVAIGIGAIWWQRRPPRLEKQMVEQALTPALATRGLSLSSLSFDVGAIQPPIAGGRPYFPVRLTFTAKLDHPLFTRVQTLPYLQQNLKLDPEVVRRISELSNGKDARRILELAGLSDASFDVTKIILLKLASPAGTAVNGTGSFNAYKLSGKWDLLDCSVSLPSLRPDEQPRGAPSGTVFEVDRPEDATRLRALVDDQPTVLARLQRAREAYAAELLAHHSKQEQSLISFFRAGTIFTGTLAGPGTQDKKPFFLELTEADAGSGTHPLRALYHNDGGWGDGRVFEGSWKYDTDHDRFAMSLASRSDQAIPYAGPVSGDAKLIKIELAVQSDHLSGELDGHACQFARVADGDEDRTKRGASPDFFAMRDATVPGTFYSGSFKLTEANTQTILLRFTRADKDGALTEAVLQDPTHDAWQCKLTGPLIGNTYRERTWPLRLTVVRNSIPPGISAQAFVLQFPVLALRMENGTLLGDYRGRPFPFEPIAQDEAARRLKAATTRRNVFDAGLRPNAVLQGTALNPAGALTSPLVLRVLTRDEAESSLTARLESGRAPGLYRNLNGKVFADAGVLSLSFDTRPNTYSLEPRAPEPFFRGGGDNLVLSHDGMVLTGQDGYNWKFEFRLGSSGP
jgi:hypothetical protein